MKFTGCSHITFSETNKQTCSIKSTVYKNREVVNDILMKKHKTKRTLTQTCLESVEVTAAKLEFILPLNVHRKYLQFQRK